MTEEQLSTFRQECVGVGLHTRAAVLIHVDINGDSRIFSQGQNPDLAFLAVFFNDFVQGLVTGRTKPGDVPPQAKKPHLLTDDKKPNK